MTSMGDLEEQVKALTSELVEKQNSLKLAGQIGQQLLQSYNELTAKFDISCSENVARIESLEQEVYSLERKLEQRLFMERDLNEELESLQKHISRIQEQQKATDTQHESVERQRAKQMSGLQLEVEKAQLSSAQVQEQNSDLQSTLDDVQAQLKEALGSMQDKSPDDVSQLLCLVQLRESEKTELEAQFRDVENAHERCSLELKSLRMNRSRHDEELDDVKSEAISYYNTLLKTREEVKELNVEIDLLKMQSQNRDKKGNSLFSEVEDRRIEAEKELITVKVKYEALWKQHTLTKEHLNQLNTQMAGLLQMCGGRADKRHMERLQGHLAQSSEQIKAMAAKIRSYENQEKTEVDYFKNFTPMCEGHDKVLRIEFLLTLLKTKESELSDCRKEAAHQEFLHLAESQKLAKFESRLYFAERQRECLQGELIKTRHQVNELLIKYEPASVKSRSLKPEEESVLEDIPKAFDAADEDETLRENEEVENDFFMQQMDELETAIKKSRIRNALPSGSKGLSPKKQPRVAFKEVENADESDKKPVRCSQAKSSQRGSKCVPLKSGKPGECNQQ